MRCAALMRKHAAEIAELSQHCMDLGVASKLRLLGSELLQQAEALERECGGERVGAAASGHSR